MQDKTLFLTLGGKFSYSHWMTEIYLDEKNIDAEIRLLNPKDITNRTEGIIEELVKLYQENQYNVKAIVPILNTVYGRVKETIGPGRGLIRYPEIKICDEHWLKIEHCLAGKGDLEEVKKVVSHPQALGQCSKYLEELGMKTEEAGSTSEAAKIAAEDKKIAAICSEFAAQEYGLNVLGRNVADKYDESSENWTRFVVLSNEDAAPTGKDKTTITMEFFGADRGGTLYNALGSLTDYNISYIESMMKGSKTEYVFWLDIDEHRENLEPKFKDLKKLTKWLFIHGSYPRRFHELQKKIPNSVVK